MNLGIRTLSLVAVAALTACGAGGGSGAVTPSGAPVAQTPQTPAGIRGTATLKIKFPTNFRTARSAATAGRKPAYVNPTTSAVIDIYVNKVLASNLDGTVGAADSAQVVASPDGTQTLNVPIFSTSSDVAVIEYDGTAHTNILALGENPSTSFSLGTLTASVAVTMQMNLTNFAMSVNSNGSNAQSFGGNMCASGNYPTPSAIYVFPIDPLNGFSGSPVPATGDGGLPTIYLNGSSGGTTKLVLSIVGNTYTVAFDSGNSSLNLNAFAYNPAYDVFNNPGNYPALNALNSSSTISLGSLTSYTSNNITVQNASSCG